MKRYTLLGIILVALFAVSFSAFSSNLGFLRDATTTQFDSNDWKMMDNTIAAALEAPDGKKINWKNTATGNTGFAQPLSTTVGKNNLRCRSVRIFNRVQTETDQYVFTYCKYPDGWKITS